MRRGILKLLGAALLASAIAPGAAQADILRNALAKAYVNNPTLRAARAGQRANDELVPQALSGWRPTVTVQNSIGPVHKENEGKFLITKDIHNIRTTNLEGDTSFGQNNLSITLSQPLFRGFATTEGTAVAEAQVKQGQQNLLATEQQVLLNAVNAYMGVYFYRESIALQKQNVKALEGQLGAANERFKVGEITKTDVAQARASLSQAKGQLANYQAQLATSAATYLQIIGSDPAATPYPSLAPVPKSLDDAYRVAGELNPTILAQAFAEDAAIHNVGLKRAPLLPQLSLQGSVQRQDTFNVFNGGFASNVGVSTHPGTFTQAQILAVATIPLYDGGLNYSLVRQAKQLASQQRINVIVQARAVRQVVAAAFSGLQGAQAKLNFDKDQVAAAQLALDGVKQEYQAGTRTTQDVLVAQQNLVTAQFNTLQDRYNIVIANYQLLNGMGKLTAADLHLSVPLYDPNENYRRTRNKWIGTGVKTVQ